MTLPDLPDPHENPWYAKRQAFDLAVKDELENRLSPDELSATFVRFLDENGDPLPPGSLVTITVNTTTGDIDDITFEEA